MTNQNQHHDYHCVPKPRSNGYTLTEMLVTISIVIVAVGIILPLGRALIAAMKADTARNTVAVAAANIRTYATRDRSVLFDALPTITNQGVAILFTPCGDIILTEHDPSISTSSATLSPPDYGFKRIEELDPIPLAPRYGVVGILRDSTSKPYLLSPPFAIAFDTSGTQTISNEYIYVNAGTAATMASNLTVTLNNSRINYSSSPYAYIPTSTEYNSDDWNPNVPVDPNPIPYYAEDPTDPNKFAPKTFQLPFEKIELVQGIIVFNMDDFRAATNSLGNPLTLTANNSGYYPINNDARDWILENGEAIFFSRYTGQILIGSDSTEME